MLVVFHSKATESVTMFENVAVELLKLMGATGRIPGAFSAQDVPAALARLESALDQIKAQTPATTDEEAEDAAERSREPPVAIAVRAAPLLSLLKRAAAANAEVVWEERR